MRVSLTMSLVAQENNKSTMTVLVHLRDSVPGPIKETREIIDLREIDVLTFTTEQGLRLWINHAARAMCRELEDDLYESMRVAPQKVTPPIATRQEK